MRNAPIGDEDLGAARDAAAGCEQDGLTEQERDDRCLAETAQQRHAEQDHRQGVPFAADEHEILRKEEGEGAEEADGVGAHQALVTEAVVCGPWAEARQ